MMEEKDMNMNYVLDELREYKKLSIKLEQELKKNQTKISNLLNSNDELKSILSQTNIERNKMKKEIDNLLQENKELSEKNNSLEEHIIKTLNIFYL